MTLSVGLCLRGSCSPRVQAFVFILVALIK
jgi:hypothetical protein